MGKVAGITMIALCILAAIFLVTSSIAQSNAEKKMCAEHAMEKLKTETTSVVKCINYTTQEIAYYKYDYKLLGGK